MLKAMTTGLATWSCCGSAGRYGIFFAAHQIASIDLTNPKSVGDVSEQVSVMSSG
jgi:hypothetical protein